MDFHGFEDDAKRDLDPLTIFVMKHTESIGNIGVWACWISLFAWVAREIYPRTPGLLPFCVATTVFCVGDLLSVIFAVRKVKALLRKLEAKAGADS